MEFEWTDDASTFDQHRFVPFITGYVTDRVTVSAEIEFEHGGNPDKDGEVKLEYAVADFRFTEAFQFRGGVLLSPLGSFNLLHDSPLNDLTARPVVDSQLIPTTLSEAGMGFFGTSYPGEESVIAYQAYLVNGFNDGVINEDGELRIRGGRGSQKQDNNKDKAIVGRVGFSPSLGANIGASVHSGNYDDADEHRLTIAALDAKVTFGALELQGEAAWADASVDQEMNPTTAEKQLGAYAQVNYHVLHDKLLQGSVVTLVARGDWMDSDSDLEGDSEEGFTLGVNFRPTEETVFKLDWNRSDVATPTTCAATRGTGSSSPSPPTSRRGHEPAFNFHSGSPGHTGRGFRRAGRRPHREPRAPAPKRCASTTPRPRRWPRSSAKRPRRRRRPGAQPLSNLKLSKPGWAARCPRRASFCGEAAGGRRPGLGHRPGGEGAVRKPITFMVHVKPDGGAVALGPVSLKKRLPWGPSTTTPTRR